MKGVGDEEMKEDEEEDLELDIKTLPCCEKALVHDLIQFDLNCLDFLHKLGEGKSKKIIA